MSVELDQEAEAIIELCSDWKKKIEEKYIDKLAKAMVKNQDHSPLQNRFQRKAETQRTYTPLNPKTIKAKNKANPKEPFAMQSSGDTKRAVKRTIAGSVENEKFVLTAKVPEYAKKHNDGTGKAPQRQFFSLNDKNGNPAKAEVRKFNKVAEETFNKFLASEGLSVVRR